MKKRDFFTNFEELRIGLVKSDGDEIAQIDTARRADAIFGVIFCRVCLEMP